IGADVAHQSVHPALADFLARWQQDVRAFEARLEAGLENAESGLEASGSAVRQTVETLKTAAAALGRDIERALQTLEKHQEEALRLETSIRDLLRTGDLQGALQSVEDGMAQALKQLVANRHYVDEGLAELRRTGNEQHEASRQAMDGLGQALDDLSKSLKDERAYAELRNEGAQTRLNALEALGEQVAQELGVLGETLAALQANQTRAEQRAKRTGAMQTTLSLIALAALAVLVVWLRPA
ncbi:MAG TPA: hypothetical protein VFK80_11900, partial [Limnochordia bacterium]|nr:hypothetical protein [Limnochordia bacterium]